MKKKNSGFKDVSTRLVQNPDPRRYQEEEDGRILHNDLRAVGNMPPAAINREFNKYHPEHMFEEDK